MRGDRSFAGSGHGGEESQVPRHRHTFNPEYAEGHSRPPATRDTVANGRPRRPGLVCLRQGENPVLSGRHLGNASV